MALQNNFVGELSGIVTIFKPFQPTLVQLWKIMTWNLFVAYSMINFIPFNIWPFHQVRVEWHLTRGLSQSWILRQSWSGCSGSQSGAPDVTAPAPGRKALVLSHSQAQSTSNVESSMVGSESQGTVATAIHALPIDTCISNHLSAPRWFRLYM